MHWLLWLNIVRWIIRLTMIVVVLRRRLPPATAIAWLAAIFLLPILGTILYVLIGTHALGRKRRRLHRNIIRRTRPNLPDHQLPENLTLQEQDRLDPIIQQTERVLGMPLTDGNSIDLLLGHDDFVDAVVREIDRAQQHVHVLYYIFEPDETGKRIAEALMNAAKRGVACRVLADAAGSRPFFTRRGLAHAMQQAGVEVHPALPVSFFRRGLARLDLRNHRKLVIVDGRCAFTGSHNMIDPDFVSKDLLAIDLSVRVTGPVVAQFQVVFAEDWMFDTDVEIDRAELFPRLSTVGDICAQVVPTGPDDETQRFRQIVLAAINTARERLVLTTPYFIPDEPMMLALAMAASRGVKVHMVVSKQSDYAIVTAAGRSYFDKLTESGVTISRYPGALLHAKTMTVDECLGFIGSANMDIRSLVLNFELGVLLYGVEITERLHEIQAEFIAGAQQLDPEWRHGRSAWKRYLDAAASLFSPLL